MGIKDLKDYLETKSSEKYDWEKEKNKWLKAVEEFYKEVVSYLEPYKDKMNIRYVDTSIHEEKIGSYKTRKLYLDILDDAVEFEPIGTYIVGAYGRIDMKGKRGQVRFLLVDKVSNGVVKDPEPVWKIATEPPKIKYIPLNAETFADSLLSVING